MEAERPLDEIHSAKRAPRARRIALTDISNVAGIPVVAGAVKLPPKRKVSFNWSGLTQLY